MVRFGSGCVAAAALFSTLSASAEIPRARAAIAALPKRGATPAAFVLKGWSVEVKVEGDLDTDKKPDTVLVLLEDQPEDDRERAVLVLLQRDAGYVLGGSNVGLVACWMCSGAKGGEGTPSIEIQKGVLLVDQMSGSRQFTTSLDRFRWNRSRRLFEWIGQDLRSADAITGESTETSCNFLTRECIETVSPPQVDEEGHELVVEDTKRHWKLLPKKPLLSLERAQQ
ncbi:MAG: hypothetical protein M3020_01920 [Myxococcota bacterium]|nr:hypothetical protein [Myxococcota bacterium]